MPIASASWHPRPDPAAGSPCPESHTERQGTYAKHEAEGLESRVRVQGNRYDDASSEAGQGAGSKGPPHRVALLSGTCDARQKR